MGLAVPVGNASLQELSCPISSFDVLALQLYALSQIGSNIYSNKFSFFKFCSNLLRIIVCR